MDPASRRLIEYAPLLLVDFDGTVATLDTDWLSVKADLAAECERHEWPWDTTRGLDANLRAVRAARGERAFLHLCRTVADAEVAGFHPERVSHELIDLLLNRAGDPAAIVTNNTRIGVTRILRHPVFHGMSARLIAKEDVPESKPAPHGILRACRLFVASPKATVFIGDSETDERAAEAAGIGIFLRVRPPGAGELRRAA